MQLQETEHSYYCSHSNHDIFETWVDFKGDWLGADLSIDHDYNHCFRFDIKKKIDVETDMEIEGKYSLDLFFVLQRKGRLVSVTVREIIENDMPEIEAYLKMCWEYLQKQWAELSSKK